MPLPEPVDPFDLPEWLGTGEVSWAAQSSVRGHERVAGRLCNGRDELACDLLAADVAYPVRVLEDDLRSRVHEYWRRGEVLVLQYDATLTLACPGTGFSADLAVEAVARLARAVGAAPTDFTVSLRP